MQGFYDTGLDVGSVSVNLVIMNDQGEVVREEYRRHLGEPFRMALALLERCAGISPGPLPAGGLYRHGWEDAGGHPGRTFINEVIAQGRGTFHFAPETRTIIDMGGEDAKMIMVAEEDGHLVIQDFAMNTMCAAGTGSFLDQQAHRLGYTIEDFSELALKSTTPPRVAGRCSVFAKTDMIHLQQGATPDYEIIAGLCQAMARNLKSNIAKGKTLTPPVAFQGGVAHNLGVRQAFRQVFGPGRRPASSSRPTSAPWGRWARCWWPGKTCRMISTWTWSPCGTTWPRRRRPVPAPAAPFAAAASGAGGLPGDGPAGGRLGGGRLPGHRRGFHQHQRGGHRPEMRVLAREYLMTAGRPLEAITEGLRRVGAKIGDRVKIMGAATTGSGRYLTGDFIGADVVQQRNHRPGHRGRGHRPRGGHHLRDRRPGLQVHQPVKTAPSWTS